MTPEFLSVEDVLEMHRQQMRFGGEDGLRSRALLESAVAGLGGTYLHEDVFSMAAAYLFHLCANHPFVDGNKRVALEAALTFLKINGWDLRCEFDRDVALVLSVARGTATKDHIAHFFRTWCIPSPH